MTEGIANTVASRRLGFKETPDMLGTTWILTPELAKHVTLREYSNAFGFYIDWPMTLWRLAERPFYVECEGLEWETPDRYRGEIETLGYDSWKAEFQTPQEWRKRVGMLRFHRVLSLGAALEQGA